MTQPHQGNIGKAQTQVPADLLWAPPRPEQLGDQPAEPIIGVNPTATLTCMSRGGSTMSIEGSVRAARDCIAPRFREIVDGAGPSRSAIACELIPVWRIGDLDALVLGIGTAG